VIQRRLRDAESDSGHFNEYDYTVVNTDFDQAVRDLASIFRANRLRTVEQEIRNRAMIASLLAGRLARRNMIGPTFFILELKWPV
jgi:guanylate kinase